MTCQCSHHDHPANTANRPAVGIERELIDELIQEMDTPAAIVTDVAIGTHFLGIRADCNGSVCTGLASTLGAAPQADEQTIMAEMIGQPLVEAARKLKDPDPFSISLGAAALNAGIAPPQNQPDVEASRIMAEKGRHAETVLVGEFPFTGWLRGQVEALHLFELQEVAGRTPPDQWDAILGRCKVLGLTGTTLITRAMASYLQKAPQAHTIIIGPTTPLSPVLFANGADVLAGCQVIDPAAVFAGIREGLSFREIKHLGIRFIAWSKPTRSA